MSANQKRGLGAIYLMCAILTIFFVRGTLGGVNAAMAGFAARFPDVELTTVMLISTLCTLMSIPGSLLLGTVIKILKHKGTLLLAVTGFLVTGMLPLLVPNSFPFLMAMRAINGLFYGLLFPLGPAFVAVYFEKERQPVILGFGMSAIQVAAIVFQTLGGILAATSDVYNIWYLYLILVIPFVLNLFLPKPTQLEDSNSAADTVADRNVPQEKAKIPMAAVFHIALNVIFTIFFFPKYLYLSSIITTSGLGTTAAAGTALSMGTVGGIFGGILFGPIFKKMKGRVFVVGGILACIDMACIAFAPSLPMIFAGSFCGGFANVIIINAMLAGININTPQSISGTVHGINGAVGNFVGFASVYISNFISTVFGQSGNLRFPFITAVVFFVVFAVAMAVKPPKMD